jgi:predicted nucleotidyltransferase
MNAGAVSPRQHDGDRTLLEKCKTAVQRLVPEATLILYGSRARGDASPASDYDVLILVDVDVQPDLEDRIGDALYEIELEHDAVISALVFNRQVWNEARYRALPLHESVDREGVVL